MIYEESTPIDSIRPYDRNPRVITQEATDAVAASIQRFGFLNPIVIDQDGVILAGHNRYKAAKKLGMQTVPTLRTTISEIKAKGYRIASNKTGELSQWDRSLLDEEIGDIMRECGDLEGMALSEWEIRRVQAQAEIAAGAVAATVRRAERAPTEAQPIPPRPIPGVPQILRSVLILDRTEDTPRLLAMLGVETADEVPTQMHAADAFRNV